MDLGVFIPIGRNGWLISTTSPQYTPTFDLNKQVVQSAEKYGFDFALSMVKFRGFGGPSRYWDEALESFCLMSGLAAVTERITLMASIGTLTMNPAIAARMAVTLDSISHGRAGVNIVSGWQKAEYDQMGLWPGEAHYSRRYDFCAEYVDIMRELWAKGRSDYKGDFFEMKDCRLEPLPMKPITVVCAAQSTRGAQFAAEYGDYNFCGSFGVNSPLSSAPIVAQLVAATEKSGRAVGALVQNMVIAEETDEAAMAKWEHYKAGADTEAIAWWHAQSANDPSQGPFATAQRMKLAQASQGICNHGVSVGSYATVAKLLDETATIPGVQGIMLTFDDFAEGIEKFGKHVQPLMKSRKKVLETQLNADERG
jgi:pyrimidine oxygenase